MGYVVVIFGYPEIGIVAVGRERRQGPQGLRGGAQGSRDDIARKRRPLEG